MTGLRLLLLLMCCLHTSSNVCASTVVADNHHYFRPSGFNVSGFPPPNSAATHRSPCPALNSLANHGYLPRNGKDLTPELLYDAIVNVFNIDVTLATRLTQSLPQHLTLADLSVHGFIEHDASLVHNDAHWKSDPAQIIATLVTTFFGKSTEKKLDKRFIAAARRQREAQCKKENPEYALPVKAQAAAYGEAALLLIAMGNYESETISVEHAKSFLVDEKIPDDFQRSHKPITTATVLYLAAQIKLLATLGWGAVAVIE